MARKETRLAFDKIMSSELFRVDGKSIDLPEAIIALCDEIEREEPESDWVNLGEGLEVCAGDLLVGFYWALSHWHGGQHSPEYRALSAVGNIFQPGMTDGPEPESSEQIAYDQADEWFRNRNK